MFSICFTAAASTPNTYPFNFNHEGNLQQLSASAPFILGTSLHSHSTQPLDQPTRLQIYNYIRENPGMHFRGICNDLGLSVGVVQYHLRVLEKAGLIDQHTDGQNVRYFEHNAFTRTDEKLISLIRHDTTGKILSLLSENGSVLHKNIANYLGISSQALSWQMNQIKNVGIVNAVKTGVNVSYSLNDANAIKLITNLTRGTSN